MRAVLILLGSLAVAGAVYAIPVGVELVMLRSHINPWFVCVLFSDLPGCVLLFFLGFRRAAFLVYVLATLVEAVSLSLGVAPHPLVWITNVAPAALGGLLVFRMALRWTVMGDQNA